MRKITLLITVLLLGSMTYAATGWFNDFVKLNVNGAGETSYWIGTDPASGTQLQGAALGSVTSLVLTGCDLKYWSDTQDRTGGSFFYKITNSTNTIDIVPATEIIWDQTALSGNDFQGTKTLTTNLLAGIPYGASYQLHVWAKSWGSGQGDSFLSNAGSNYVATFTKPNPTSFTGTYKVGTASGSDFTSLSAAITAINAGTIAGNVVLEITSDITEAANIGLGVNTNSFSITIRPDADANRTITFTQLADNSSPSGHFVIGYLGSGLASAWSDPNVITTSNITIDGYAVGGTTRRLTFTNTVASHTNARVISIVGGCVNTTIKDCTIENKSTHTGSPCCIAIVPRKGTAIDVAPSTITIENNILNATGSVGMGVRLTYSAATGTPTSKTGGFVLRNNVITAQRRLLEFNYNNNGDIYGNEFNLLQTTAPGALVYGVYGNTAITGIINIYNNKFKQSKITEVATTGTYGIRLIALASGPTAWNIYNNTFSGMDRIQTAGAATLNLSYIQVSFGTANIYNNTFYMPALTTPNAAGYYNAINNSNDQTTQKIKNNIFISDEPTASCAFISNAITNTNPCDYNLFYHRRVNANAKIVGSYVTLVAYQTAANQTKDINSKSKDVEFASATDLSITGTSINDPDLGAKRLAEVTTDIFGNQRDTTTYKGAHEASNLTLPAPTKTFTVTAPNGTGKVYVAGLFTGKKWDVTTPYELTATANPNEFTGAFACADGVEYKYLCEKGSFDYQAAVSAGGIAEANRIYNAVDPAIAAWLNMKTVKLNVSFASGVSVPTNLFVKGSWDSFATPIELTKTDNTFSTTLSGLLADKIPSNTEYKYFTNDGSANNWESDASGNFRSNRWTIFPTMNDEIIGFTAVITKVGEVTIKARILHSNTGITVVLDGQSTIELYNINGTLIEKTVANGNYSHDLANGIYIIRINGNAVKFVK